MDILEPERNPDVKNGQMGVEELKYMYLVNCSDDF